MRYLPKGRAGATALLLTTALCWPLPEAAAAEVVTQDSPSLIWWLLDPAREAHQQILAEHDVSAVSNFDLETLRGVDVVYVNGYVSQGRNDSADVAGIRAFVKGGGRLVLMGDTGGHVVRDVALAFGVDYSRDALTTLHTATVIDFDNPITDGPVGRVEAFNAPNPNAGLLPANPDFRPLAVYSTGGIALGYLPVAAGEVVFLTDQNILNQGVFTSWDNETLWRNLFEYEAREAPICPDAAGIEMWPPRHQIAAVDLAVSSGVVHPSGQEISFSIDAITSDEPVDGTGDGDTACDGSGLLGGTAYLRAERAASGDGRVYAIAYTATDEAGASCRGLLAVGVRPSQGSPPAVDSGQAFDATAGCD